MFAAQLTFECFRDTTISAVEKALSILIDSYYFNGQIIGREFPTVMKDGYFVTRVVCPDKNALSPDNNSQVVEHFLNKLADAGLLQPKLDLLGVDINSDSADECHPQQTPPSWQILYTTFVHSCSPLRCGDHFSPIGLYQLPPTANGDHKTILKWQQDWQACDQLQMNAATKAQYAALEELTDYNSDLTRRGTDICKRIECLTDIPTYYYLYRVGGESLSQEQQRQCPGCGGSWSQDETHS